MKTNTEYKNAALAALKGNWAKAVLATVVIVAISYIAMSLYMYHWAKLQLYIAENRGVSMVYDPEYLAITSKMMGGYALFMLLSIFLLWPLTLGYTNAFRRLLTGGENDMLGNTFKIATKNYWHKVWGMFLMYFFIALWTLLLIIPGIIKAFSYAMTPYILEEHPELSANDAIDHSRAMMKGHKFDLFWLYLSFIGWFILAFFTFGIGGLWLSPYMSTSRAGFYEDVKAEYEANGGLM